jgi:CheY-like chemotaxis protein
MKKHHVLIVDDNPDIRTLISITLGDTFYQLAEAANADQAFQYLASHNLPDLMILDLAMPGMSGTELLDELKGNPDTAPIAVIVLSANAEQQRDELLKAGATNIIAKPFGPLALLQMVEDLFDK